MITAIDPGLNGGVAWICEDGITSTFPMPKTDGDLLSLILRNKFDARKEFIIYLEDVPYFTGGAFIAPMAKLQRQCGIAQGMCQALGARLVLVTPQKWQKALWLGAKKSYPGSKWKNHLKQRAQQLYPNLDVTLKTADALLILEYARMVEGAKQ